jgi:hypothetical protein
MTIDQLLLSADRSAQLTAALSNLGVEDPLGTCLAEASSDVARLTAGYVIDESSTNGWIRALTLYKAYGLVGPVPTDIKLQCDEVVKELTAIAKGERPNLERAQAGTNPTAGAWGGEERLKMRGSAL